MLDIQPIEWIKSVLNHPYSCFMLAAIQYNNAMFHIFAGPLFANVQGYVYLDLIIWGISPLLYLLIRPKLLNLIRPKPPTRLSSINEPQKLLKQIKIHKQNLDHIHKRRLFLLTLWSVAILISFLFMNYSQTFNWNYFTRVINLDFGYLIFDLACRLRNRKKFNKNILTRKQKIKLDKPSNLLIKWKSVGFIVSLKIYPYFCHTHQYSHYLPLVLMLLKDIGQDVLALTSVFSCLVTLVVPLLYFFHFKNKHFQKWSNLKQLQGINIYHSVQQEQLKQQQKQNSIKVESQQISSPQQIQKKLHKIRKIIVGGEENPCSPPTNLSSPLIATPSLLSQVKACLSSSSLRNPLLIFILVNLSLIINISYLALWIMQALNSEQTYIQYNQTLLVVSTMFMIGSGLYAAASIVNLNYPFQFRLQIQQSTSPQLEIQRLDMEFQGTDWGYYINKYFLLLLGIILLLSFTLLPKSIYLLIFSTIGLGFHSALVSYLYFKIQKILQQHDIDMDLNVLSLYLQTFAYLIVPIVITVTQTTILTYFIYGWISSLSIIIACFIL